MNIHHRLLAALDGQTVGDGGWKQQPQVLAGVLDIDSSEEGRADFVRFCDAFNIPIITFVDVPGFYARCTKQEYGGLIKNGARTAVRLRLKATVPKDIYGDYSAAGLRRRLLHDVMSSKHIRGDVNYAWPTAEIAVMGAKGAVEIIFRAEAKDPEVLAEREAEYKARFANLFNMAAQRGYIDDVIMPHGDAAADHQGMLKTLANKKLENPWKKVYDNIPL